MKIRITAVLLAAVMLCGCSASREAELQSEIDDLKSQLEERDEKNSSDSDDEDSDNSESPSDDDKPSIDDSTYDGIDWDNIPEAPASDFGYRVFYGEPMEDGETMAGYSVDESKLIKSILIFDYYGHDKYVKIPKEIDGLPVTRMGTTRDEEGYRKYPWDPASEWVDVQWDESVFRDTNVENVFIPEHLRSIYYPAFDDCPTLKSISVDPNNLAFFSEDGVLFWDTGVVRGAYFSSKQYVYTKLPKYTYVPSDSGGVESFDMQDEGEWVMKTPDCAFGYCYIDSSLSEFALSDNYNNVIKFTDGTYGALDQVTNKYIPIDAGQFKRSFSQYLYRYPEGKPDKSYTVKKHTWSNGFDENGNEEFLDGFVCFESLSGTYTRAFNNVKYLEKLEFEDGVEAVSGIIAKFADSEIPIGIEKVVFPASLVSLGDIAGDREGYFGTFSGLTKLKEYKVDKNNPVFKAVDGALLSKDGKILYSMPCKIGKKYTVPDGVELISGNAFANAQDMTITIPASVKYLNNPDNGRVHYIFRDSSNITLNVSSKTEIRDIFEGMPEICENRNYCPGLTVNFVD